METGAPCLSFDIIEDMNIDTMEEFPLQCYMAAGTQGERDHSNNIIIMKMSNLHKTKKEEKDEESDEDDDSEDEDDTKQPELETAMIKHEGAVNRIRVSHWNWSKYSVLVFLFLIFLVFNKILSLFTQTTKLGGKHVAATWSETGKVHIWDLSRPLNAVNDSNIMATYTRNEESPAPVFTFSGHQVEGFAVDWCTTTPGGATVYVKKQKLRNKKAKFTLREHHELNIRTFFLIVTV